MSEKETRHGKIAEDKIRACIVLPKEMKEELTVMAELEGRTVSNLIVKILDDYRIDNKDKYDEMEKKRNRKKK